MLSVAFGMIAAAALSSEPVGKFQMAYPYPSLDGGTVVFQGDFDGRWQLYVMTVADGKMKRLHVSPADDTHPAFSPDGKRIAFISNRDGNDEVYVLDLASGSAVSVSPHPGKDGHPKWSADGQWLLFNRTFDPSDKGGDRDSAIMRVRSDGTSLQVISDTPRVETFASFSPDGSKIALVEWYPSATGELNRNGELVVVDLTTGQRRNLTNSEQFDAYPFWGASGKWIYHSTIETSASGERRAVVYRVRPDGSVREKLSPAAAPSESRAIPTKDETWLFFNISRDGATAIERRSLSSQ